MDQIIPRWEWRTFGQEFGHAEERLTALAPEKVQKSEELYLLAAGADANVKIRDQLLDIKILEQVNADGLEQWRPVLKASFPLTASAVASLRQALGLPAGSPADEGMTLERLQAELTASDGPVRAVYVGKARTRYHIQGCAAELTEVIADGTVIRTVAIEHEDPAKVMSAVRAMGLARFPNICYPKGLRQAIGLPGKGTAPITRQAVIDVGTNSVKFHVGELHEDGIWSTVVDRAEVTRLGEGISKSGAIAPAAIERTVEAIAGMTTEAARLGASGITAVGTMGLRTARNSKDFLELVKQRCDLTIEVISGEDEGRIAYLAVLSGLGLARGDLIIFDTGGGSSQFTFGRGTHVDRQFSLNVGAVRFTETYHLDQAVSPDILQQARSAIAADLSPLDDAPKPEGLVGMGGSVTNMTAVMLGMATYDPDRVQGAVVDREEVERQIERYRAVPAEERRQIAGLQPRRAEVILAGACIVAAIMEKLSSTSLSVSDRGLRHGVLLDRFGGKLRRSHHDR
jgi:exopolyphosphatase / guanosine-5'-triphosphate,3'-diphosphate pyrophosphatase